MPLPGEPVAEHRACPGHPASNRSDRPSQFAGGFVVGQAFEVTEHQRLAKRIGEPGEFVVDQAPKFLGGELFLGRRIPRCFRFGDEFQGEFAGVSRRPFRSGAYRHPAGHSMKPRGEKVTPLDRRGASRQDEKRRLEGIFNVVDVAQ